MRLREENLILKSKFEIRLEGRRLDLTTIRAVVRNAGKGRTWADRGCEVALADISQLIRSNLEFSVLPSYYR